jgi:hypothetical protein
MADREGNAQAGAGGAEGNPEGGVVLVMALHDCS